MHQLPYSTQVLVSFEEYWQEMKILFILRDFYHLIYISFDSFY